MIVLEGADLVGKSCAAAALRGLGLTVLDRSPHLSGLMTLDADDRLPERWAQALAQHHARDLVVVLIARDQALLEQRLSERASPDGWDLDAVAYNQMYARATAGLPRLRRLEIDGLSRWDVVSRIAEMAAADILRRDGLPAVTMTGESKIFRRLTDDAEAPGLALAELRPTLYSHTASRYGEVPGTDALRLDLWGQFAGALNAVPAPAGAQDWPFLSAYAGRLVWEGRDYALTRWLPRLPPIEIVWKRDLVGTMKHRLVGVDGHQTLSWGPLRYDAKLPADIVRFDWRNPLPHPDECIPEDFARFYVHTEQAAATARRAADGIDRLLHTVGCRLVDICFFVSPDGRVIHSEITPDGARIRAADGAAVDKDIWRSGRSGADVVTAWSRLHSDLRGLS